MSDMKVEIKRFEHDATKASRGVIFINDVFYGYSLERPNYDNIKNISRIPAGIYRALKVNTKKRGDFWLLQDVPGRTEIILFHPGNTMEAFAGCIGFGDGLSMFGNDRAITNTKKMCDHFMVMSDEYAVIDVIIT